MFVADFVATALVLTGIVMIGFALLSIRIVDQHERSVVFRLGRFNRTAGPGLFFVWPLIEWQTKLDYGPSRQTWNKQEEITKDDVSIADTAKNAVGAR